MKDIPFHVGPRCVCLFSPMIGFGIVSSQTMDPGYDKHLCSRHTYFLTLISVAIITLSPTFPYPFVSSLMCLQQRQEVAKSLMRGLGCQITKLMILGDQKYSLAVLHTLKYTYQHQVGNTPINIKWEIHLSTSQDHLINVCM